MDLINVIIFVTAIVMAYIGSKIFMKILIDGNTLEVNYRGEKIPNCFGLLFIFVQIINLSLLYLYLRDNNYIIYYIFSITFMGMVGLLDDLTGEKKIKGLKGHIVSFLKGKPTTGGIKAGTGFLIALFISVILSNTLLEIIVNIMLIGLFTNLINLFDLRPGRSTKVFILASILLLVTSRIDEYNFILYSFYGILLIYFPLDLKAKVMMGDTGSNVMGITLGIYCAFTHNLSVKLIYLLFLLIIHVIAERYSFTKIIENNKLLKFIDDLGR